MPLLPSAADYGPRPAADGSLPPVVDQSGSMIADSLNQGARSVAATEVNRIRAENQYDMAVGKQKILTAQIAARQALQDDPDYATHTQRFEKQMGADVGKIVDETTNPRIKSELAQYGQLATQRGSLIVNEHAIAKRHDDARGTLLENLESMRQSALQASDPETRTAVIGNAQTMIDAAVGTGDVSHVEAAAYKKNWTQSYADGAVRMLDDPGQVKMLSKPDGTPAAFLEPDKRAEMLRSAQARVEAEERRREAEARQEVVAKQSDFFAAAYHNLPNATSLQPTKAELKAAYPKTWGSMWSEQQHALQFGADIDAMKTASPEQIDAMSEQYAVKGAGPGAAMALERQDRFAAARTTVLSQRKADPTKAAIQAGYFQPLNFQDPDAFAQEIHDRTAKGPEVSRQLGINAPLVSNDERKALTTQLASMPPEQRLGALDKLRTATGDDGAYFGLMRTLLPNSPVTAIAGALTPSRNAQDTPVWFDPTHAVSHNVAKTILTGEDILNAMGGDKKAQERSGFKGGYQMPQEKILRQQFDAKAGDLFRGRPALADAYYAAWRSYYAGAASAKGTLSDVVDGQITQQASKDIFGQTTEIAGKKVAVPQGMSVDRFPGLVDAAVTQRMKGAGYDDEKIKNVKGYGLTEATSDGIGTGRYYVDLPNGKLSDRQGGYLTIDLQRQYSAARGAVGGREDRARAAARAAPQSDADVEPQPKPVTSGPILGGRGPY